MSLQGTLPPCYIPPTGDAVHMVLGAIVSVVVALLVGGLGISVSGRLVAGVDDYSHAVVTALLGDVA